MIRVGVGNLRQTQIPMLELPRYGAERLCGIRCISTRTKTEAPGEATLTTMAVQRLDALLVLTLLVSCLVLVLGFTLYRLYHEAHRKLSEETDRYRRNRKRIEFTGSVKRR